MTDLETYVLDECSNAIFEVFRKKDSTYLGYFKIKEVIELKNGYLLAFNQVKVNSCIDFSVGNEIHFYNLDDINLVDVTNTFKECEEVN